MHNYERTTLFIDGEWVPSAGTQVIGVVDPVHRGGVRHRPGRHSRRRGRRWPRPEPRRSIPGSASKSVANESPPSSPRWRSDCPTSPRPSPARWGADPISQTVQTQVPLAVAHGFAAALDSFGIRGADRQLAGRAEPYGVVAAITPWNYPLYQVVAKVLPAIAAGAPWCSSRAMTHRCRCSNSSRRCRMPVCPRCQPGVSGPGKRDRRTDGTASRRGTSCRSPGPPVSAAAWENWPVRRSRRSRSNWAAKSANVILDGADLAAAVKVGVGNAFLNGGADLHGVDPDAGALIALRRGTGSGGGRGVEIPVGDPWIRTPGSGRRRRHRNSGPSSDSSSAPSVTGPASGRRRRKVRDIGYFVKPTVFADVDPDSELGQEEVFGPFSP